MSQLHEYYNTGDDSYVSIYGDIWKAQTFTPSTNHKVTSVKLLLYRVGSPGTVTVSIRATTDGKPTGADLCVGTTDGNTLTTNTAGEWREITLGNGYDLSADTQYAIVIRALNAISTNRVVWCLDASSPTYGDGTYVYSSDSGDSWTVDNARDCMFEEWGVVIYDEKGRTQIILTTQGKSALATFTDAHEQIILVVQGGDAYPPPYDEKGRTQIILGVQGESDLTTFVNAHGQIILATQGESTLATFTNVHEQIILAVQGRTDVFIPSIIDEKGKLQVILAIVGRTDTYIVPPPFTYVVEIRDADSNLVAILENAHEIGYVQTINAPHSLKFSLPSDDAKLVNIILANQLWLRDCKTGAVVRKFQLQRQMDVRQ